MVLNKRSGCLLLAATLFAIPASAQDRSPRGAAPGAPKSSAMNWTGLYFGAHAGWGLSRFKVSESTGTDFIRVNGNGVLGGLQAGYQYQLGNNLVIGTEISGTLSHLNRKRTYVDGPDVVTFNGRINGLLTATAKVGYAIGDFLPYIKGGYAGGRTRFTGASNDPTSTPFRQSAFQSGWTVGGGVDYAVTRNLLVGLDYSYVDLGRKTKIAFDSFGTAYSIRRDVQAHTFMLRASYLFGG